jgi:glyceraldehyde-3-phosphate dehydrogenase/erythrose-4-phosphate dehydrogenase
MCCCGRRGHGKLKSQERFHDSTRAINGFGRIGRNIYDAIAEANRKDIEIVAIPGDLGPVGPMPLLRYDSVHGRFPAKLR